MFNFTIFILIFHRIRLNNPLKIINMNQIGKKTEEIIEKIENVIINIIKIKIKMIIITLDGLGFSNAYLKFSSK